VAVTEHCCPALHAGLEGGDQWQVARGICNPLRGIRAEQLGHHLEGVDARALSQTIKELENQGLAFEGAEASFELLIRRKGADYRPPFQIVDYTVLSEQREDQEFLAEATVKVRVDDQVVHTAADGNGPVNALDAAMRKALGAFFPQLESMRLVDYKVRIIDGTAATAARTRVIIDSLDEGLEWSTMGSDTNIISASAIALADSFEYAIWKREAAVPVRPGADASTPAPADVAIPGPAGAARRTSAD